MAQILTREQENLLIELYHASDEQVGVFRPASAQDVSILEELLQNGLVILEVEEIDGTDQWYAAMTELGYALVQHLTTETSSDEHEQNGASEPRLLGMNIEFDLNVQEQAALVEKMAELNREDVADVLSGLFELHQSLNRGEIDALLKVYPQAVQTISRMVQVGVESQLLTHEQQRIEHLLSEVSSLKSMIANQELVPRKDKEAIPTIKPVGGLRPVLPKVPDGQPKQLNVPTFDLPDDDEDSGDLFVVQKDEDAGRRASQNFIESLQKLQK